MVNRPDSKPEGQRQSGKIGVIGGVSADVFIFYVGAIPGYDLVCIALFRYAVLCASRPYRRCFGMYYCTSLWCVMFRYALGWFSVFFLYVLPDPAGDRCPVSGR
jgi:hypothetical protein